MRFAGRGNSEKVWCLGSKGADDVDAGTWDDTAVLCMEGGGNGESGCRGVLSMQIHAYAFLIGKSMHYL